MGDDRSTAMRACEGARSRRLGEAAAQREPATSDCGGGVHLLAVRALLTADCRVLTCLFCWAIGPQLRGVANFFGP